MGKIWMKIYSYPLFNKIYRQPTLNKILKNTAWIVLDKSFNIIAGLLVGAWTARYLGPTQYGLYNYALALVALFIPIASLGLNKIVVREILQQTAAQDEILGTSAFLQFITSLLLSGGITYIACIAQSDNVMLRYLVAIVAGGLIFQSFSNTIDTWFQSQLQAKYIVWAHNIALGTIAITKVILILSRAPLIAFAWATLAQAVIFAAALAFWYHLSGGRIVAWRLNLNRAKELLGDSWPLIISGMAIGLYMRIDQVMLGNMAGEAALGIYSAAVRLSELSYFIPTALASSFFPTIISSRANLLESIYRKRLQAFYDLMVGISYIIVIPLVLASPLLVATIFGAAYTEAGAILRVHLWAFVFVSIGVARGQWLVAENRTKFSMMTTILGAAVNIGLNFWLIPRYAGLGAAWATLISYAVSAYLSSALSVQMWPTLRQQTISLIVPLRISAFKRSIDEILQIGSGEGRVHE